ncbi:MULTISPECIES: alpha/beta hydrolase [unclassified Iodidimonas]|jgi:pimeloyl-ACP methyl ester carboxylesterase|uniref:alpha/beta fold hydrolase n=1 Tax=unclassified Iodidimonas TaxID=2626145 RepID=UPI002483001F|nr:MULTISPECIES: alpha/beta hydrolase [unclassified Iodidimonas]
MTEHAKPMPISLSQWQSGGMIFPYRGHDIFYRRGGAGPPLLLLHGFPTASWDYAAIWDGLCAHHDVIAPDFIGFGFSAKPLPYAYSIFDQADLIEQLLAHCRISRVAILSHDFGDSITQELLARQNENSHKIEIQSAMLLNGGIFYDQISPLFTQRLLRSKWGAIAQHLMNRRTFGRSFRAIFGPQSQPSSAELDDFWRLITHHRGKRVMHAISQYLNERQRFQSRWSDAFAQALCPLRFVYGPQDPVSGTAMARRFAQIVPDADIVALPGIGHYPQVEAPEAVRTAFADFEAKHAA